MPPPETEHRLSSSTSRILITKLTQLLRTHFSVKSGATNISIKTIRSAENKQYVNFLTKKNGPPEIKPWYSLNKSQLNHRCVRRLFLKLSCVHLIWATTATSIRRHQEASGWRGCTAAKTGSTRRQYRVTSRGCVMDWRDSSVSLFAYCAPGTAQCLPSGSGTGKGKHEERLNEHRQSQGCKKLKGREKEGKKLILCSRVLPEKLTVPQLVKKFPAFYGTWKFIIAFTSFQHLSLSVPAGSMPPQHGASSGCGWRNGLQIWRTATNTLNKQSRTAEKGWSSSLGVGRGANNSSL
jgi:hypothetical protein